MITLTTSTYPDAPCDADGIDDAVWESSEPVDEFDDAVRDAPAMEVEPLH
jgi:hypothetical protein